MNNIARKNALKEAKQKIETELREKWNVAHAAYMEELNKENCCDDRLDDLLKVVDEAAKALNDWKKSKKKKKKESIQWSDDIQSNLAQKPKKPTREVKDWDALRKIRNNHLSSRPRASEWLQEGVLVKQRGSQMPMMVVSIRSNGIVQCLAGGMMKNLRDLSLRPAFDEE